jgi:hypothetical protein
MRLVAIALCIAIGGIASRAFLRTAPASLGADLSQPIAVATNWGSYGLALWCILAATLAVAAVPSLRARSDPKPPRLRWIVGAGALALAAGAFWRPLFSSDVYAYAAYGEMARLGLNPYVHQLLPPAQIFSDAIWQWQRGGGTFPICVYGEAFVALARAVMTLPLPLVAQLDAFRVLSCLALLVCTALLFAVAPGNAAAKRRAALFLGGNPVAIWAAIEGHNDAIVLAVVLTGFALMRYARVAGTFIVTLGALVKLPAIGAALAVGVNSAIARDRPFRTIAAFVGGGGLVLLGSVRFLLGVATNLAPHAQYHPVASVQALGPPVAVLLAVVVASQVRRLSATIDRWAVVALALWIAIPDPYPWYALWILPIGACATDRRVVFAVFAVTASTLLRYLPDTVAIPSPSISLLLGSAAVAAFVPLLLPIRVRAQPESAIMQRL